MIDTRARVETLSELIDLLRDTPDEDLGEIPFSAESLADDLADVAIWKEKAYTRTCLYSDSRLELILLCWSPGAATAVHCHAGSECWMHIASGELTECAYDIDGKEVTHNNTRTISGGDHAHINDEMGLHMLANNSGECSMSIHLYSPSVGACQTFDLLTKKSTWVTLKYDQVLDVAPVG